MGIRTIGNQSFLAINKCLTKMPNMRLHMLQQVYKAMCESKILYGAQISGIGKGWKIVDGKRGILQKVLRIPRNAAK
jgi:hypothetical protein